MDMHFLIHLGLIMVVVIVCYTIPAICLHRKYDKKMKALEDKYEALEKHFNDVMRYVREDITDLFEMCADIGNVLADECEESNDEEEDELDDIRIMDSEEYLFSDRKKMHLYYNKEEDKLGYCGQDTGYDPCFIVHPSKIIGDGLNFFGLRSNDERVVYVRNNKLKVDFMIKLYEPVEPIKFAWEEEPVKSNECRIKNVDGHYEVYVNGEFYCSADTRTEAVRELEKALDEEREE